MIDMGPDKSVLILLKHCKEMKQQEMHLRLITLLLLLGCSTLFIFTICADLRQREDSASSEQRSPDYSKQDRVCPTDTQTNSKRLRIDLRSESANNKTDPQYLRWNVVFGEKYNKERRAIVIPENGFYFVYVRTALNCHGADRASNFEKFSFALHKWNEGYNMNVTLMDAWDGITCSPDGSKSAFVGQLFELLKGDHVSVWIKQGYKLITNSAFGAYLV
ncbi:uncharacterized protein [Cebidichthys violaceus]|uniref:uncharacterized protein n=1 Tax=Cebidichthys violaceus TaxID=271503 RepID=UPI0035CB3348